MSSLLSARDAKSEHNARRSKSPRFQAASPPVAAVAIGDSATNRPVTEPPRPVTSPQASSMAAYSWEVAGVKEDCRPRAVAIAMDGSFCPKSRSTASTTCRPLSKSCRAAAAPAIGARYRYPAGASSGAAITSDRSSKPAACKRAIDLAQDACDWPVSTTTNTGSLGPCVTLSAPSRSYRYAFQSIGDPPPA